MDWNSPGQNTGVGSFSLLQGIFPTQGSNPGLPHCKLDSLPAELQGKPKNTGVGSISLLQWIFPTQESNQGLLHCRQILYQLSYQRSPNFWIIDKAIKQESSRKTSTSNLLTMPKPLTVWIIINCGKFWKRWEYQTTLGWEYHPCLLRNLYTGQEETVRTGHGTTDWFQIEKGVRQSLYIVTLLI